MHKMALLYKASCRPLIVIPVTTLPLVKKSGLTTSQGLPPSCARTFPGLLSPQSVPEPPSGLYNVVKRDFLTKNIRKITLRFDSRYLHAKNSAFRRYPAWNVEQGIMLSRNNVERAGRVLYLPLYATFYLERLLAPKAEPLRLAVHRV